MSQDNLIKLECTNCKRQNYFTFKNKRKLREHRLEISKFCKHCGSHQVHKEAK